MEMAVSSSRSWRERSSKVRIPSSRSVEVLVADFTSSVVFRDAEGKKVRDFLIEILPNFTTDLSRLSSLQKAIADRQKLIDEYASVTREWSKSDDPKITKKREIIVDRMRAQYHELDPYVRGRGAYHRNGNVSPRDLLPSDSTTSS